MGKRIPSIILGFDPGTKVTGYGVLKSDGHQMEPLDFGAIRTPHTMTREEKYVAIFSSVEKLLEQFSPDSVSIETQFFHKNVLTAIQLSMIRALIVLAAARKNIPIFEYAPKKAKLAVTGSGDASKERVQKMIQLQCKLEKIPTPFDASDALALAICHSRTLGKIHV